LKIRVPHNFEPRFYQMPFFRAMDSGYRRACLVWHRRSGKTKSLVNFTTKKAFERIGTYYHAFPEYGQGRKILWDGIDRDGNRILGHHIPQELRKATNKTEMKIELINGSIWQIIGADNYDSLVGPNPVGLILDEWAVSSKYPDAWNYFRPILVENGGWAVFPYTPRGRNHGWELHKMAMGNNRWYSQILTVDDTEVVSKSDIEEERLAGMSDDMIQQDFYCSYPAATENIVIPYTYIQQALTRDVSYNQSGRIAGFDAARFGDDRNAMVIRQAGQVIDIKTWAGQDTVQSAGRIINKYRAGFFDCIAIDVIGIGAGIYDMVKNAGIPCVAVNVAESASDDSRFVRLRDELWWRLREWFMEPDCSLSSSIVKKDKDALIADIQDIYYDYNPKGQIKIEKKKDMKERLGFSPDIGDALIHTFAPQVEMKLNQVHRSPFGKVPHVSEQFQEIYNPLTFHQGGYNALRFHRGGG